MKPSKKLLVVAVIAVSVALVASTTALAFGPRGSGHFGHGWNRGGGWGGYYHRGSWGWYGGWYPWSFGFTYYDGPYYYPYDYYYAPPVYYYSVPSVVYSSPPTVMESSPPPASTATNLRPSQIDRPLSPTAVDRDSTPSPKAQRPPSVQPSEQGQPMGLADVKALVKSGISDEVILSQIRNSRAVYHLTTAEIIDLKTSGVSEKVIDSMINTASR
ncbi:MAG TPA: hypothetical protein VL486_08575 [Verrucomicrobiae bacterium]|nr:hypothetical protein [Verrucomicrobiae bacterium]